MIQFLSLSNLLNFQYHDTSDPSYIVEMKNSNLESYLGFIKSLSGYQRTLKAIGEKNLEDHLAKMSDEIKKALGYEITAENKDVEIELQTSFHLFLARKQK